MKNQEPEENKDSLYFTIIAIGVFTIIGIISSLGRYNLFTDVRSEWGRYDDIKNKEKAYISTIHKIYGVNDIDHSLKLIDSLLFIFDTAEKKWDLNYIKARIYYEQNSIDSALKYNTLSTSFRKHLLEKNIFLKVGCLLKQGAFDKAEKMVDDIKSTNPDIRRLKGHFYEVVQKKEKALMEYRAIMEKFPSSYNFLNYNIEKIQKGELANFFLLPEDNNIGNRTVWTPRPLFYRGNN